MINLPTVYLAHISALPNKQTPHHMVKHNTDKLAKYLASWNISNTENIESGTLLYIYSVADFHFNNNQILL